MELRIAQAIDGQYRVYGGTNAWRASFYHEEDAIFFVDKYKKAKTENQTTKCRFCNEPVFGLEAPEKETGNVHKKCELLHQLLSNRTVKEKQVGIQLHDISFVAPGTGGEPLKEPEEG